MMFIPFNKPTITETERQYVMESMDTAKLSGDGKFTKRCHQLLQSRYGFTSTLLTTSCTDALELAALLAEVRPGDEVIMPSFTFVSTANAFALRGARIVFADSCEDNPNIDPAQIESLITEKTKIIVPVHYAGISCDMTRILQIANRAGVLVVEDAAQALGSTYRARPVGTLGMCSAFSFHDTKNISCGEGGMIVLNGDKYTQRAEVLREKGTNRAAFFRGEIDRYGWVEVGSSFLPSELNAAFLFGQLERITEIQARRVEIFNMYLQRLGPLLTRKGVGVPHLPENCEGNGHAFYIVLRSLEQRTDLIAFLKGRGVQASFHYSSLHRSKYFEKKHDGRALLNSDKYSERLLRLPLYFDLSHDEFDFIVESVSEWTQKQA